MLVKILTCPCYAEKFHEEENEYEKKLHRFLCKCKDKHLIFILICEKHPYVADKISNMEPRCTCPILDPHEICNFCVEVRYRLNFRAFKFCLKRIPSSIQDHIVAPFYYFKRMPGCEPFFAWNRDLNKFEVYLDNSYEPYNIKETD